jgi:undecaprenyl-diphosphatase
VLELDLRLFLFLHHALSGAWLIPMAVLSIVGGGWGSLALVPLLAAARTRRLAGSLVWLLGATAIVVFVLKRVTARVRPCGCEAGIRALVFDAPADFSFPSGHAAGSFAFAAFFALVLLRTMPAAPRPGERLGRWIAAGLLMLLAVGVGLSRIALGVHYPADVAAGAALGTVGAAVAVSVQMRSKDVGVAKLRGAGWVRESRKP